VTESTASSTTPPRTSRGDRALEWWTDHCHPVEGDPATRARLRRCRSTTDALSVPAAMSLARRLGLPRDVDQADDWRVVSGLALARVLAHVDEHDASRRAMQAAGWKSFPGDRRESDAGEDRPRLSEARFHRLLQAERGEELVTAFTRLVALLDGAVNVPVLAEDFLFWGDRTRHRWAFDYYAAAIAAPADPSTSAEDTDA
jgi:CRISPR system Cascade subunit CasB